MSDHSDEILMNEEPKNPWGKPSGSKGGANQSSGEHRSGNQGGSRRGGGNGGGPQGPDFDIEDLLRKTRDNFGGGFKFSGNIIIIAILVFLALWLSSGLYRVQPGEHAVIQRFGEYLRTQEQPGLGFHLPNPIESVKKLNVTLDRRIHIGFQEGVSRRGGTQKMDIPQESLMLTSDANIVDIDVVVLWNIAEAYKFLFNIRDQEETLKKSAESALREVVGQTNLQPIITEGRDDVAVRIKQRLQETMDAYGSGISIKQVLIQDATVHPDVIEAFDDVVAALQDAEKFQNEATIYRNDIIPKARGEAIKMLQEAQAYKESQIAKSTGDSQRFTEVYRAYLEGKEVTKERIYIETMEKVFANTQKIIIDQESGGQGVLPYLPLGSSSPSSSNAPQRSTMGR
jgi:membrane protease subunit HflK